MKDKQRLFMLICLQWAIGLKLYKLHTYLNAGEAKIMPLICHFTGMQRTMAAKKTFCLILIS